MKITYSLIIFLFVGFITNHVSAQLINGCVYMQGSRLEVGIAPNGGYGTPNDAPAGYHPNNAPLNSFMYNPVTSVYAQYTNALGFVADYDSNGWAAGTPPYFGDYFLPGTPQEGWSIEANGVRCDAFSSNYMSNPSTGFTGGPLTGTNINVTTNASGTTSLWSGTFNNMLIKQQTTIPTNKLYFIGNVKLYNTGSTTLSNVYYMRTLDPDNEVSIIPANNAFTTENEIVYQLPSPGNKSLVSSKGITYPLAYLGLGTIDCRSKVFICNSGLFPPSDTLGSIFSGTNPNLTYTGVYTSDVGIGIVYQLGNIAPGDSAELNFAYILNQSALDEALDLIKPKWLNNSNLYQSNDTIFACQNTTVPVSIVNGEHLTWTWSSSAPLSNSTGLTNHVTFGNSPVQVTAYGTGICNDTIDFYLAPTNTILSTINASICSGNAYTFNGVSYTVGGTYHDTVTTPFGCDSIVTLNLNVGANSSKVINTSICQGNTYFFNGATLSTAGTYYDTLVNAVGCDSLVTLNLQVGTTTTGSFSVSICQGDSYLYNGIYQSTAGTYLDTIVNALGCDSILTLYLSIKPKPIADFTLSKSQICSSENVTITYTGSLSPGNTYNLNTDGGNILSGTGVGPYTIQWNTAGVKNITLTVTLNGCSSIPVTKQVTVIQIPNLTVKYDSSICIGTTANIEALVDVQGCTFNWNLNSANLISGNTSTAGPLTLSWNNIGTQTVSIQCDNQGCLSNNITVNIHVHEVPTATIISLDGKNVYCETDLVHLSVDNMPNSFYQWTPLELFTHYAYNNADLMVYDDTTLVTAKITTSYGCIAEDSMYIYAEPCEDFFIPNSFTPNWDGHNDVFHVVGLRSNALVEMLIYDRWGRQVFQSSEAKLGWNGYYKGAKAESGVYFYHVKISFPNGTSKIVKGDVTLLR